MPRKPLGVLHDSSKQENGVVKNEGSLIKQLASMKIQNYQPSKLVGQTHQKVSFVGVKTKAVQPNFTYN